VRNRATRQVRIQARVIEVALHQEFAAGIDWKLLVARAGDAVLAIEPDGPPVVGALNVGLNVKDFDRFLRALSGQGKVNVLASPTVSALNNEPAIMRVLTHDVFFKTTTRTDVVTGRVVQRTTEPEPFTEGIVLSVTPRIADDGVISLSIAPSLTERTGRPDRARATQRPF
jgi:type II secretory pathway component GspD/PulD (secretin)